ELVWEANEGLLEETFLGRHILFLGRRPGGLRDLYRARVRLTSDGEPLGVHELRNLTDTPVGDDVALEARGDRATFATLAFGHIQGVSVLELRGIRASDRPATPVD